jgi:hypothetical protein
LKKHTKVYFKHFDLGEQDFVYDEVEWVLRKGQKRATDIHHIKARGMGGSNDKDVITNLMALSRVNHDKAEDETYPEAMLQEIHNRFLQTNPYQKWKKIIKSS